jgi:hypothetical protein
MLRFGSPARIWKRELKKSPAYPLKKMVRYDIIVSINGNEIHTVFEVHS